MATVIAQVEAIPERQLSEVSAALKYMLAGNATFTLRSQVTGTRFTYRVRKPKPGGRFKNPQNRKVWFVQVLVGPDNNSSYRYLGMVEEHDGETGFKFTAGSGNMPSTPMGNAFRWMYYQLSGLQHMPQQLEIWHSGRCGRCGKLLTVPDSIAAGIGPDCAGKM